MKATAIRATSGWQFYRFYRNDEMSWFMNYCHDDHDNKELVAKTEEYDRYFLLISHSHCELQDRLHLAYEIKPQKQQHTYILSDMLRPLSSAYSITVACKIYN